jgi:GDP-L-fucose synthase
MISPNSLTWARVKKISIKELALTIQAVVGFEGELVFDTSKPDGTPRKLMDVSRLKDLGWHAQTDLKTGIEQTYAWYLEHLDTIRR